MVDLASSLQLAGYALGALGAGLVFVELFQLPSYVDYQKELGNYRLSLSPTDPTEYTWAGRVGALLVAFAFALLFLAAVLP